jgi:type II secretory ATPase GspE/PulE/Tfp pilus assembly ATPase PilB-like protein
VSYTPKHQELRELGIQCDHPSDLEFVKSTGCLACHGTGRAGVVGIHEVAIMTDELRCMFRQKASDEQIRQQLLSEGMAPFYESALHKVVTRQIASTTVFAYRGYGIGMPKEPIKIDVTTGLRCH